jgi:guanosine-3',5'-bis(diphosphate) 3'-pyrophosphohydrolase
VEGSVKREQDVMDGSDENSLALLLRAAAFSAEQHRPQRRKNAEESPYINHPIEVAHVLASTGGITDVVTLVAALLHDTIEDTPASAGDLEREFGAQVRSLVDEVTDDKRLEKAKRKELQILHAPSLSTRAKQIKLGDRISNVRDVLADPPANWDLPRRLEYLNWSTAVAEGCRGANEALEECLDELLVEGRAALVDE